MGDFSGSLAKTQAPVQSQHWAGCAEVEIVIGERIGLTRAARRVRIAHRNGEKKSGEIVAGRHLQFRFLGLDAEAQLAPLWAIGKEPLDVVVEVFQLCRLWGQSGVRNVKSGGLGKAHRTQQGRARQFDAVVQLRHIFGDTRVADPQVQHVELSDLPLFEPLVRGLDRFLKSIAHVAQ